MLSEEYIARNDIVSIGCLKKHLIIWCSATSEADRAADIDFVPYVSVSPEKRSL